MDLTNLLMRLHFGRGSDENREFRVEVKRLAVLVSEITISKMLL